MGLKMYRYLSMCVGLRFFLHFSLYTLVQDVGSAKLGTEHAQCCWGALIIVLFCKKNVAKEIILGGCIFEVAVFSRDCTYIYIPYTR